MKSGLRAKISRHPPVTSSMRTGLVTDRLLIFGRRHLQTALAKYEAHYNGRRRHRSRQIEHSYRHTVEAPTRHPKPSNSPWIRL
jgi:hypothetical protein